MTVERGEAAAAPEPTVPPPEFRAPADYVPAKAADVLELDMEDGFILYNHDSSLVHHLNPSAAIVWHLCDSETSVAELANDIAEEFRLDAEATFDQVASLIAELDALGLVENTLPSPAER